MSLSSNFLLVLHLAVLLLSLVEASDPLSVINEEQTSSWDSSSVPTADMEYPIFDMQGITHDITSTHDESHVTRRQVSSNLPAPYLVVGNRRFIILMNVTGHLLDVFRNSNPDANIVAVDVDYQHRFIFWTDVGLKKIYFATEDASTVRVLVSEGIQVPDGIAWDWINLKLYWTDAEDKDIEVLDPISSHRRVLFNTGVSSIPRAIVLDPQNRRIYWTDWGIPAKIEQASMDGSFKRTIHSTGLHWPNALTLDFETQTLFWADAALDRVEASSTSGASRRVLTTHYIYHPFGMTFYRGWLFWTDWATNSILASEATIPFFPIGVRIGLSLDPMGIQMMASGKQPRVSYANPCRVDNGGCSHLCLLSSTHSRKYSCSCPTGMSLSENKRTCTVGGEILG